MLEAIDNGTAFTLDSGNCFLYYTKAKKEFSTAVAIFGIGNPLGMIALLYGIFTKIDKTTVFMLMKLHPKQKVGDFKSLFTKASARRMNPHEDAMMIRVDKVIAKYKTVFEGRVK